MRTKFLAIPLLLAGLLLSGCAAGVNLVSGKIQSDAEFNELVLKDVQAAIVLATRSNDQLGLMCWTYLEAFTLENAPDAENPAGTVIGVFSEYQKARNVRKLVIEVEISDQFRLECGPMLTESMGALGRIGVKIAI